MKRFFLTYARYSKRADASVLDLVGSLPLDVRNRPGRAFYGSLHQLTAHILDGTLYFLGLFRTALAGKEGIFKPVPGGPGRFTELDESGYARLRADCNAADDVVVKLIESCQAAEFEAPVAVDWYKDPPTVPLHFLLNQLIVHGVHHRGQISQVLDELGVEHDFSGIDLEYMS